MKKQEAIEKLNTLKGIAETLVVKQSGSQEFKKWHRDTEIAIERIFGEGTRHTEDFENIYYSLLLFSDQTTDYEFERAYQSGVKSAITVISSFVDEINEYWEENEDKPKNDMSSLEQIKLIINRFHKIARQLRSRYSDRDTIEIEDEYDVQDLFHALLKLFFDDVRPEEYTPSYAGAASSVVSCIKCLM